MAAHRQQEMIVEGSNADLDRKMWEGVQRGLSQEVKCQRRRLAALREEVDALRDEIVGKETYLGAVRRRLGYEKEAAT